MPWPAIAVTASLAAGAGCATRVLVGWVGAGREYRRSGGGERMVVHGGAGKEDIFVVLNGRLIPQLDPVQHSLTQVSVLVIEASGAAAAIGALYRINSCLRDGCSSLRSISLPENVAMGGDEVFEPAQRRELYDVGYRMATARPMFFAQPPGSRREP